MAIVKREKNEKTGEYWYSVISKEFTISKDGEWVKVMVPIMVKAKNVKTSKDGKSQYVRINEKNLSRAILITKDVKEDQ